MVSLVVKLNKTSHHIGDSNGLKELLIMATMMLKLLMPTLYLNAGTVHQNLNVCTLPGPLLSLIPPNQLTSLKMFMLRKKQSKRGGKQRNLLRPKKKLKQLK